jgi:hypothetical protein
MLKLLLGWGLALEDALADEIPDVAGASNVFGDGILSSATDDCSSLWASKTIKTCMIAVRISILNMQINDRDHAAGLAEAGGSQSPNSTLTNYTTSYWSQEQYRRLPAHCMYKCGPTCATIRSLK